MNKKNATKLLKKHKEQQKANKKTKNKSLLSVEDRLKRKQKAIEKFKDKDSARRIKKHVNSKKNEIYRRNARKNARKILNKKN